MRSYWWDVCLFWAIKVVRILQMEILTNSLYLPYNSFNSIDIDFDAGPNYWSISIYSQKTIT